MFFGVCRETWQVIASVATAVSAFLAVVALVFTGVIVKQNTLTRQLQLFEVMFRDIRELDQRYIDSFATMTPQQKTAWSATFFNTIEYLSFMLNHKFIRNRVLREFFVSSGALPGWKSMFDQHVAEKILGDAPTAFPEFKKATIQSPD
jgi:hypothetical protein